MGCRSNDTKNESLNGTWQLVERWQGGISPIPSEWILVENGYKYYFKANHIVTTDQYGSNCSSDGTYLFQDDEKKLSMVFKCTEGDVKPSYDISFEGSDVIVFTPNPNNCVEGCKFRFRRINNN